MFRQAKESSSHKRKMTTEKNMEFLEETESNRKSKFMDKYK